MSQTAEIKCLSPVTITQTALHVPCLTRSFMKTAPSDLAISLRCDFRGSAVSRRAGLGAKSPTQAMCPLPSPLLLRHTRGPKRTHAQHLLETLTPLVHHIWSDMAQAHALLKSRPPYIIFMIKKEFVSRQQFANCRKVCKETKSRTVPLSRCIIAVNSDLCPSFFSVCK